MATAGAVGKLTPGTSKPDQPDWFGGSRAPAIPIVLCLAFGICLDRWLDIAWLSWLGAGFAFAVGWACVLMRNRSRRLAASLLLFSSLALGGAWHHWHWSVVAVDDVSRYASDQPRPVRLRATVVSHPTIVETKTSAGSQGRPEYDRTVCTIRPTLLFTKEASLRVSGLARLDVTGHMLHAGVGDEVEILGRLSRPRGPLNPAEFDFRTFLRCRGMRCVVRGNFPEAVSVIRPASPLNFWRARGRLRDECEAIFVRHLDRRTVPVACALFVGTRTGMESELRRAFRESGTMHMLSISGLHVGILAMLLWGCCRVFHTSTATTFVVVLLGVAGYAFITDARPPVVRSAVLIFVSIVGWSWNRQALSANTLAISGIVVLWLNPSDLFDIGAQLSFLAMIAIIWCDSWRRRRSLAMERSGAEALSRLTDIRWRWLHVPLRSLRQWLLVSYGYSSCIWLFTTPLIAAYFNLVSPVGLIVNVLLIPVVTLTLALGFGVLFCGLMVPPLTGFCAVGFDLSLRFLLDVVELSAQLDLGHVYVPAPPGWWLVGVYGLFAALVTIRLGHAAWSWCCCCIAGWVVFALSVGLSRTAPDGLRCTFLSIGHGCSILVETPNGKTLLYDAGMIQDGERAYDIVTKTLWDRRLTRIDALVVSHADVDHFNGVPGLLEDVPVGSLIVAQSFLDFQQRGVVQVCEAAAARSVPIRLVWRGDHIRLDDDVTLSVLHPKIDDEQLTDNANSIILAVEFAGRRLLFTGDLEADGMTSLLRQRPFSADVALSPHHGSAAANSAEFADWSQPKWVIISGGRRGTSAALQPRYGDSAEVLSTYESGAVTFSISSTGRLRCATFLEN